MTPAALGAALYNVGAAGALLGLQNDTGYSVYAILREAALRARRGVLLGGSPFRSLVDKVFAGIEELGGL